VTPRAKVLTVSTSVHEGTREDASGVALVDQLLAAGFQVVDTGVCPDGIEPVASAIRSMAEGFAGLLVTTGGTGFAPTDVTPEATAAVLEREAPGLAEASRAPSRLGVLSRGRAGTLGQCLVLNVPGSPRGAVESIDAVLSLVPHALELLAGGQPH
jgi:molybdenum cofactor synthesis domain-containing protein